MTKKVIINSQADFEIYTGKTLFISAPLTVSTEMIQQFCRSVNQMDWFHFDAERCKDSPFGAIVAPGMFTAALLHSVYFDNVELRNLKALFLGTDRFRILKPLKANTQIVLTFDVDRIESREQGFAVHYNFTWTAVGEVAPLTLGNFIVRYWPE